ncbi:MAG: GGDEF domain-containing protein [Acidobacteria bacterium]|nr:GGDEF domain-containing protein [Acidobacteriota bacterium]
MKLTASAHPRTATLAAQMKNRSGWSIALLVGLGLLSVAWLDRVTGELPVHHFYYFPIILAAVRFGQRGGWLTAAAAGLLYYLANQHSLNWHFIERDALRLAIFLAVGWVTARLVEDADQMRRLAHTDDLTGLHNLRSFEARYAALCRAAIQAGTPLTLLVLDLDRLKALNARHDHLAGAQAVQTLGQIIAQEIPADAVACRYGGDEFVIALPRCPAPSGLETAHRIRLTLLALAPTLVGLTFPAGTLSTSIGAVTAVLTPEQEPLALSEALFRAADEALFQAKEQGRNCVHYAPLTSLATARSFAASETVLPMPASASSWRAEGEADG